MVAAIAAARAGAEVFLIEGNDRVGKKLLSTGNGKCNFTNRGLRRNFPINDLQAWNRLGGGRRIDGYGEETVGFHSNDPTFPKKVLERFGYEETISFFQELGVVPKERNGGIYPAGGQASAVLDLLRLELEWQEVRVICSTKIKACVVREKDAHIGNVQAQGSGKRRFYINDINIRNSQITGSQSSDFGTGKPGFVLKGTGSDGKTFSLSADRVILACGGKAAPGTGSDGSGYALAKKLGHSVTPLSPALVQLKCQEDFYKQLSGVRTDGAVRLYVDGRLAAEDQGELQLTAYGISGIPVFQVSRFAGLALQAGQKVEAELDLMPSMSQGELEAYFRSFSPECYGGLLNKKLLALLLKRYGREPGRLAAGVKSFRTRIKAVNSYENAQVTAGGVDTRQIDPGTMMSKIVPGLYFAGELVDVDGSCGGYNLQWAWSSGYVAGRSAAGL